MRNATRWAAGSARANNFDPCEIDLAKLTWRRQGSHEPAAGPATARSAMGPGLDDCLDADRAAARRGGRDRPLRHLGRRRDAAVEHHIRRGGDYVWHPDLHADAARSGDLRGAGPALAPDHLSWPRAA